jgi:serine O-acetyltransferase
VFWDAETIHAVILYRISGWLRRHHVPLLPWVIARWNLATVGLWIGPWVIIAPGVYFPHGHVIIDGFVTIGSGCVFSPFVTVGLLDLVDENGEAIVYGPTLGKQVQVGTGAKLLGPISVGDGALIGANAVVLQDVPAGATAVGVPARVILPGAHRKTD